MSGAAKRKDAEQYVWACPKCGIPDGACSCHAGVALMSETSAAAIALRIRLVDFKSRAAGGDE
jgi:hypothetical protein